MLPRRMALGPPGLPKTRPLIPATRLGSIDPRPHGLPKIPNPKSQIRDPKSEIQLLPSSATKWQWLIAQGSSDGAESPPRRSCPGNTHLQIPTPTGLHRAPPAAPIAFDSRNPIPMASHDATPLGLALLALQTQGSSSLATLGFMIVPRWGNSIHPPRGRQQPASQEKPPQNYAEGVLHTQPGVPATPR